MLLAVSAAGSMAIPNGTSVKTSRKQLEAEHEKDMCRWYFI